MTWVTEVTTIRALKGRAVPPLSYPLTTVFS